MPTTPTPVTVTQLNALWPTRFYTPADPYHYSIENLCIDSLRKRDDYLATLIDGKLDPSGIKITEGTNGRMGVVSLVAGAAVILNTTVTANTRIFLCGQQDGGVPGFLRVSARTNGVSFKISSSSASDTSLVAYLMCEHV